ncbi:MAG TPA: potassium-transporting ATPase subunit C, partial [Geobacteraceae bacterium]
MKNLKPAILLFVAFTVICGGIYPAVVTGVAYALFPAKARGSILTDTSGKEVGSRLIGQPFSDPKYFWPRPSATPDFAYNPMGSGGSNSGPTNPDYLKTVGDRVKALRDT